MSKETIDVVVIGAGFYGVMIALYMAKKGRMVWLVERSDTLLSGASYHNQARIHNGYHYPRSFTTAYRSRINMPKFMRDWPDMVKKDFVSLYAIARQSSKVTAKQFERFCQQIGAPITKADALFQQLFDDRRIEAVFQVEEYTFDAIKLSEWAKDSLHAQNVRVCYNTCATAIFRGDPAGLWVDLQSESAEEVIACREVFNCTYSGLNQLAGDFPGTHMSLKHEITEMALIEVPEVLSKVGVTVMDGAFFSILPYPSRSGLHTLSHVRYTPHCFWNDAKGKDPYLKLKNYEKTTRSNRMILDAGRYLPSITSSRYVGSLFTVKTILTKNEVDDGRPILFEQYKSLPGLYSVLGGKIDNIYDVLERLDAMH